PRPALAPAAAAVDAHGGAALRPAVGLEPRDQRQPLRAVVAAAGDDGAERLAVGAGELGDGGGLDRLAVPGEPEKRVAGAHGMFDVGEAREPTFLHRRLDQRGDVRPELVNLRRIDANQLAAQTPFVPAHSASKTRVNALMAGTQSCGPWPLDSRLRGNERILVTRAR